MQAKHRSFSFRRWIIASAAAGALMAYTPVMAQPTTPDVPGAAQAATQDVPVTNVVLFSSGVGYFQHAGQVTGDGEASLRFKAAQINDVLKSLVLQDMNGGQVTTVTYPSQDPIDKTLRSFQVDITGNPPLGQLLNQLRGARVTVQFGSEKFTGTVLGVEPKTVIVGEKTVEKQVLNLLSGATIRSIELEELRDLQLEDPALQEELAKALSALAQARDQDKKPVTIAFRGTGQREIRMGYVVEAPVWKTSYRLILGKDVDKPVLQGWAIVENQTDNDWKDVSLTLVSGRPISFQMDLYQPLYIPRPTVELERYASLRPQMYGEGMALGKSAAVEAEGSLPRLAVRGSQLGRDMPAAAAPMASMGGAYAADRAIDASSSVQSVASAEKLGELFSYTVGNVSLPRQKSAMLPIITDQVTVEKLSIYNASVLQKNPLNGARLTNSTDKHLLTGPITVMESSAYAGDAQIDNVPPGQNRLLSYGIDLQMRVDSTKNTTSNSVLTGKISQGVLYVTRKYVATQTYQIENKSDRDRKLLIEHPIRQGWKLVDSPKPEEATETLYRFKTGVEAGKSGSVTVNEETVQDQGVAILPSDPEQLVMYIRTGEIPQQVKDALGKAVEYKQALQETQRQINELNGRLNAITVEQNRIRENMGSVERKSQYYNRLETKLNEQETQIEKIQVERDTLNGKMEQQRRELEEYLKTLSVG